jgi:hypothetical protein
MSINFSASDTVNVSIQLPAGKGNVRTALTCMNDYTSFLSFEKLEGSASHLSCAVHCLSTESVFGLISAWQESKSKEENDANAARLLVDLAGQGAHSIQILGHRCGVGEVDANPVRAFLVTDPDSGAKAYKEQQLSMCQKYSQHAVAFYEHREIRVFSASGGVVKGFNLKTLEARHLIRILGSLVNLKLGWLESGFFDASPVFLCAPIYDSCGLVSDVAIGTAHRIYEKASGSIRERPYRIGHLEATHEVPDTL